MRKSRIPDECKGWKVIAVFGSKDFSDPELIKQAIRELEERRESLVIALGVNGIVPKTIHQIPLGRRLHVVTVAPDESPLAMLDPQSVEYRIKKNEGIQAADDELLEMSDERIAFSRGTPNCFKMIMGAKYKFHKNPDGSKKKPITVIYDPEMPKRPTLAERIAQRQQGQTVNK